MNPLVTIGIPTYNRPELLGRAIAAVAKQDYPEIELLVADNASPGEATREVVESYSRSFRKFSYVRHGMNIGSLGNFMFLLRSATGTYFMWLADDDEISANYVSSLVKVLESNPRASAAAGHWLLMQDEQHGRLMPTSSYPEGSALARTLRFIWRSDDAFLYALHRTNVLRQASFRGYAWPNRTVIVNWAYVYLLDIVVRGRVLLASDPSVQFINHDYTQKRYEVARRSFAGAPSRACRRINVHYLYWEKCARLLNPVFLPLVMAASLLSLFREGGQVAVHGVARRMT